MNYKDWLAYQSKLQNRDVSLDEQEYDLPAYFKNQKYNPKDLGHLEDTYKKPNHPTFSDQSMYNIPVIQQGGAWSEEGTFKPSKLNLENMGRSNLQKYFNEVENPEALNLPENERMSNARRAALESLLKK
jgi:hypothetical protein